MYSHYKKPRCSTRERNSLDQMDAAEFAHENYSYIDQDGNRRFNLSQDTMHGILEVLYAIKNAQETLYQLDKEFDIATYYDAANLGIAIREYAHSAKFGAHYAEFARLYFSDPQFKIKKP